MKCVEREETRTYKVVVYVANDGKEFHSKESCLRYERSLELENKSVIKNRKNDGETFEGYRATFYYIQNDEDFECLETYLENLEDDYVKFGPGWYISWWEEDYDGYGYYLLLNYQNYLSEHKRDFEGIVALNDSLINYGKEE